MKIFNSAEKYCSRNRNAAQLKRYFRIIETIVYNIPLTNIVACTSNGVPAMVGTGSGFPPCLTCNFALFLTIHCSLNYCNLVIKVVNKLKSVSSIEFSGNFGWIMVMTMRLLYHTEAWWLSKGNCTLCFVKWLDIMKGFKKKIPLAA